MEDGTATVFVVSSQDLVNPALDIIRARYADFGSALGGEKLREVHFQKRVSMTAEAELVEDDDEMHKAAECLLKKSFAHTDLGWIHDG